MTITRTLVVTVVLACPVIVPTQAAAQAQDKGMAIFVEQKCTQCHALAGRGNKNGALDDVGSRLGAAEIKAWIVDPVAMAAKRQPASTRKPAMKKKPMSAADVDVLVAFLATQKK
ncbi:hypothetical protein TBR22_A01940 [Luteitalea sp. TBR-22]|uniref:c-type cytochrome n=1 Tax=Luteitalea sp. TBR-22 TaxID=2802971 RepID=UPI001AF242B7|nr:c-type cytochrome [Luteitalea sp. TBR-22]BCS30995.1 hypothetical protein TBR22_A01940 [Luteitalea sp. TBR-22]